MPGNMSTVRFACVWGTLGDIAIVCIIGIISGLLRHMVTPFHRGFFQNDESLMHPYRDSTITSAVMYSVGFTVPSLAILLLEGGWVFAVVARNSNYELASVKSKKSLIYFWLWRVLRVCIVFYFGVVVTHLATNIGKYSIGRLRPHFFDVCKPDWSKLNGTGAGSFYRPFPYIEEDICTGQDSALITEARVSFPSGHSSNSVYCMVFLVIYMQKRLLWEGMLLIKPFLQTVFLLLAIYTCLSRVSDYKHHPTDVLAGGLLGLIVAVLVLYSMKEKVFPTEQMLMKDSDSRMLLMEALSGHHVNEVSAQSAL